MAEEVPTPSSCGTGTAPMSCCCGSSECFFLKHNSSVLDSVEADVQHAARMGQALLERHEAYMADAERDRRELTSRIEQLEMDNKELEAKNARTIEENRELLSQLESLNTAVTDSEDRIKSLEATLLSSQQVIRRLEGETARAEALERQLACLEQEQADLQKNLATTQEDARCAMSRWRRAERGINDLQDQLERMEREGREERERHAEVLGRMERQREVERSLDSSAGRLKAAAVTKSLSIAKSGSNVVSHFVRDLLQDNANLQQGIAELREMLMNSNDEIQALREQLLYHQPLDEVQGRAVPTLEAELDPKRSSQESPTAVSQELHIHHHYHVAAVNKEAKKPRKKRIGIAGGIYIPPSQASLPPTPPAQWRQHQLNRMSRESAPSHRWSVLSEQPSDFAPSSVPSSPQSNNRNSVFDPATLDSFPASPTTSIDPMSPTWRATHRKQPSNISSRSFQAPGNLSLNPSTPSHNHTIIEESDDLLDVPDLMITTDESAADDEPKEPLARDDGSTIYHEDTDSSEEPRRRRLRRSPSDESVISLYGGGLDIHTLKSRPSQLTLRHLSSATTIAGSSTVTARPMLSRDGKRGSTLLRDSFGASPRNPVASLRAASGPSWIPSSAQAPSVFGKWTGWRPWGGGTSPNGSPPVRPDKDKDKQTQRDLSRPAGINQVGVVPGFSEYLAAHQKRPSSKVMPDSVDRDALLEGLAE
ncbi:uncharacterized protein BCR38DRAFT_137666 [Pseudomassariella vexata]|uniref:Uncharacterized protein n=1 Tax=Pseudomassariella vexata TaxID=1141098 RepID=A0A1Y2EAZ9_9PEZI|nr:uncharacterized protein BCR38DRAFT_137666 [Pseudomassariella vexata]ORY68732.1 hypothetical protein BCR38DRAFT_137666 [Pseudomassariella vexata]